MAVLNQSGLPTLLDQIKRTDPGGGIDRIVEALTQRNAFLEDAVALEGNLPTGHRFTTRTGLPGVTWRRFNEGVAPGKSITDQVDETCGMLEGFSVADKALARLNGNEAAFRASEDSGFIQALSNEAERSIIYASTKANPEKIMGLAGRLDSTTSPAGNQIIKHDASASGNDQTSMYLVGWGPDSVFLTYPKGSKAGLTPEDLGTQLWTDGNGNKFTAYVMHWAWQLGLCVKDWRFLVRIANIDVSNLLATGSTGNALIQTMVRAYHQIFDRKAVRLAWYCNRTVGTYLHLQAMDAVKNSTLKIENVGGEPITTFLGIPVRESDGITNTETIVS